MAVAKTRAMLQVELEDAVRRNGPRRDIRDILDEALREGGGLDGAGVRLEVDKSTISRWVAALRGRWDPATKTLTFEDYRLTSLAEVVTERALVAVP